MVVTHFWVVDGVLPEVLAQNCSGENTFVVEREQEYQQFSFHIPSWSVSMTKLLGDDVFDYLDADSDEGDGEDQHHIWF